MKIRIDLEITDKEFAFLWQKGVSYVLRENPRLSYSQKEKEKGARIAAERLFRDELLSEMKRLGHI